jgi:hypothetical protein
MRLKRQYAQRRIGGCGAGLGNDRLMAQMHPVEIADRNARAAIFWGNELMIPNNVHNPHPYKQSGVGSSAVWRCNARPGYVMQIVAGAGWWRSILHLRPSGTCVS